MKSTINHEEIKNWILKWNGTPAIGEHSEDQTARGVLRINFPNNLGNGEQISWDEFFDIFEADNLLFRYNNDVTKGSEIISFNFSDREKSASSVDDKTSLPESNKMAEENMYDNFDANQLS